MNERIKGVVTTVREKWSGLSIVGRVLWVSIPIALVAIIIVLVLLLNQKDRAVLFSGVERVEAGQIAAAVTELGVSDVTVTDNGDIIVPEDQVDYLRMQMYMQGYPTTATEYEIWNNGVSIWSTDSDKREIKRQQLEARLGATLSTLEQVQTALVNLNLPETKDYVLTSDGKEASCSVTLRLREGASLDNATVRAIYRAVSTSVSNLPIENISIMDTSTHFYEWVNPEDDIVGNVDESGVLIGRKRLEFQEEFAEILRDGLSSMLTPAFGENGYSFNVTAVLDFDKRSLETEWFYPNGTSEAGVINHQDHVLEAAGMDGVQGPVGVYPNADISPDYPEYITNDELGEFYYRKDEIQYSVSNSLEKLEKDGFAIKSISVGLLVNQTNMTVAEREGLADLVAKAAGTDISNVSVYNMPFAIGAPGQGDGTGSGGNNYYYDGVDSYRDLLLFIVIALGVLLILLLILSLFMSRSRKKKIRRRQEAALAAAQANGFGYGATAQESEAPQEIDFNIASLTEEAAKDSRETILKREISEFAKNNPEIVAAIIKNMLRED